MNKYVDILNLISPQSRRENVLKSKYLDVYNDIMIFTSKYNIKFRQRVFNYINGIDEIPCCKMCDNLSNFHNNKYGIYCSSKCQFSDSDYTSNCTNKLKDSLYLKYGVDSIFKIEGYHNNNKINNVKKHGVDNLSKLEYIKTKISKTKKRVTIDKYSSINLKNINDDRVMTLFCDKCNEDFKINYTTFLLRKRNSVVFCTNCNKLNNYKSSLLEKEISNFIKSYGFIVKENIKIGKYELDIYLPELEIGFEFNGLYWHSDIFKSKNYHLDKTKSLKNKGISIYHIWEDDWKFKVDIIKSIIIHKLNKTQNKIMARKCVSKEVYDKELITNFLNTNNIKGYVESDINIGLFNNDDLVSLMTFKKEGENFEILRFNNKINTIVVGGVSKSIKFFLKNYKTSLIYVKSDISMFDGNSYQKLGFNGIFDTEPNYYKIENGIRLQLGLTGYGIYDCGCKKWEVNI